MDTSKCPETFSYDEYEGLKPWTPAPSVQELQIRLFELQPRISNATHPSKLCGQLFWQLLASPVPYTALSYCWGRDAKPTAAIEIFGKSLAITETLTIALKHLQH